MPVALRYLLPLSLALLARGDADRSVWEKPLAPGVTFRTDRNRTLPLDIYALRITPGTPGVEVFPALTGRTVYDDTKIFGRGTVTKLAAEYDAQAAINADFFPLGRDYNSGDPLGLMVTRGQLLSGPFPTRAVFAWGPTAARMGYATMKGTVQPSGGANFPIDGLNQDAPLNSVVLNDETAGIAAAKLPNVMAVLRVDTRTDRFGLTASTTVESLTSSQTRLPVAAGRLVLVGQGTDAEKIAGLRPGSRVDLSLTLAGMDFATMDHAVGGGPILVKDGVIAVADKAEGFPASFSAARHPRTGIGATADGDLWLVNVDGRSRLSRGATLDEMAVIMRNLGCVNAINLDGGGSSALSIAGAAVNRPSDGTERAVANGIVVKFPQEKTTDFSIRFERGFARAYRGSAMIPDREIIWSARGPISIDQDGRISVIGAEAQGTEDSIKRAPMGKSTVRASVGGRSVELDLPPSGGSTKLLGFKPG